MEPIHKLVELEVVVFSRHDWNSLKQADLESERYTCGHFPGHCLAHSVLTTLLVVCLIVFKTGSHFPSDLAGTTYVDNLNSEIHLFMPGIKGAYHHT